MTSEATGAETGQTQAAPEGQAVPEAQAAPSAMTHMRPYDAEGVRKAVYDLLVAIGEDPERDGLRETPQRMARAYAELFAGLSEDPTTWTKSLTLAMTKWCWCVTSPCIRCVNTTCCPSTAWHMWAIFPALMGA